jgi:PIN domain nuclease of toxin-antitoxin system
MIILDTHIWHWWVNQIPGKLSPEIIELIEETDEVAISAISCFEMAWLVYHRRIDLGMTFEQWFNEIENSAGIRILPVTAESGSKRLLCPNIIKIRKIELLLPQHCLMMPVCSVLTRHFPPTENWTVI